ncbi:hypothetical protein [Streptomyces sp. AC550_RSS872]|uniref:hypothetical protein n=1 Tax=Streptomyces sp. AC550_RSS872 TaxID=2823689 RepID=UPI001C265D93|nr:hypothetical protein [Streptomyces sp. AC550_RSS872]
MESRTLLGLGAACREAVDRIRSADLTDLTDLTDLHTLHLPERPPASVSRVSPAPG